MKITRSSDAAVTIRPQPRTRALGFLAVAIALLCLAAPAAAQITLAGAPTGYRDDRVLVRPLPGVDLGAWNQLLHTTVLRVFPQIGNLTILQLAPGSSVTDVIAAYLSSGVVQYAEPDYFVHALAMPNDPHFQWGDQWNLYNQGQYGGTPGADIKAPLAWNIRHTSARLIVAVVDTGVRYTHEDLAANMWRNPGEVPGNGIDDDHDGFVDDVYGINAITGTGDPLDDYGHGTHMAGIIGAVGNNGVGIAGVTWSVRLMACKFIDSSGRGSISDAITCLDYARSHGARIVNASWGAYGFSSTALYDAIASLRNAGIIFVAAAGNDGTDNDVSPLYPASYDLDNIIAVAATGRSDNLAPFSNYGLHSVDIGAPGDPVFSCWNGSDSDYRYDAGTSQAAPQVVGACALVWAMDPTASYRDVIHVVLSTADPVPSLAGKCVSGGRLDLFNALNMASWNTLGMAVPRFDGHIEPTTLTLRVSFAGQKPRFPLPGEREDAPSDHFRPGTSGTVASIVKG